MPHTHTGVHIYPYTLTTTHIQEVTERERNAGYTTQYTQESAMIPVMNH